MNRRKTSEHFVSLINLIILIIINYQLSIERSSLVFNSQSFFFLHGAHVIPEDVKIAPFAARQRALSARLLFSDMYTRVKSSLCVRPFSCKECVQQKQ